MSKRDELPKSGETANLDAHLDFKIKRKNVRLLVARHRRIQKLVFRSAETDEYPGDADVRIALQRTYETLVAERVQAFRAYANKPAREVAARTYGNETAVAGRWANRTQRFLDAMEEEVNKAELVLQRNHESFGDSEDGPQSERQRKPVNRNVAGKGVAEGADGTYVPSFRKIAVASEPNNTKTACVRLQSARTRPEARPKGAPKQSAKNGYPRRSLIRKHLAGGSPDKALYPAASASTESTPAPETCSSESVLPGLARSWKSLREIRKMTAQASNDVRATAPQPFDRSGKTQLAAKTNMRTHIPPRRTVQPRRIIARTPYRIRFRRVDEKRRVTMHRSETPREMLGRRRREQRLKNYGKIQQAWEDLWAMGGPAQAKEMDREHGNDEPTAQ